MKKLTVFFAAALAMLACSKQKDLENRVGKLEQQFEFDVEINEGPYCYCTDRELSASRVQTIPFKIKGNVEGLQIVTDLICEMPSCFESYIEMTGESEGNLCVKRIPYVEYDGGEVDLNLEQATLKFIAFNADKVSCCKSLEFYPESYYIDDMNCSISKVGNDFVFEMTKSAGSYELSFTHRAIVPKTVKESDLVDLNEIFECNSGLAYRNYLMFPEKMTSCGSEVDAESPDLPKGTQMITRYNKIKFNWTATTSERKLEFSVYRKLGEMSVSDLTFYLQQK